MQTILYELVNTIEAQWRGAHYAESAFANIAAEALVAMAPHRNLDISGELAGIARGDHEQGEFIGTHSASEVIPFFWGTRFGGYLHFWYDEIGNPHSHAWSGAYQVLAGTCVQASFSFEEILAIDPKFKLGTLETTHLGLLRPGMTVRVVRGPEMIHGLSYVDRPGVAISFRTHEDFGGLTLDYWFPGIAIETGFLDASTERRIKALNALYAIDPSLCAQALEAALGAGDFRTCFFLLRHSMMNFREKIEVRASCASAAQAFGEHADRVMGALAELERDLLLRQQRKEVRDLNQRFLLSALHLAPTRNAVHRLVAEHYPGEDPQKFVARNLLEMSSTLGKGGKTLLGTPDNRDLHAILGFLLDDDRTESVLARLEEQYDVGEIREKGDLLREACQGIRGQPILRPLFAS
jgi:hypothetical protein